MQSLAYQKDWWWTADLGLVDNRFKSFIKL